MKSYQSILWILFSEPAKGALCLWIFGRQQPVGCHVLVDTAVAFITIRDRLKGRYARRLTFENQLAHGSKLRVAAALDGRAADADTGAELLINAFQARRRIDGIASGRVVESFFATEIFENRNTSVDADARHTERDRLASLARDKRLAIDIKLYTAEASTDNLDDLSASLIDSLRAGRKVAREN